MEELTLSLEREFEQRIFADVLKHWIGRLEEPRIEVRNRSIRGVIAAVRRSLAKAAGWTRERAEEITFRLDVRGMTDAAAAALRAEREAAEAARVAIDDEHRARDRAISTLLVGPPSIGERDIATLLGVTRHEVRRAAANVPRDRRERARLQERRPWIEEVRRAAIMRVTPDEARMIEEMRAAARRRA